MLTVRPLANLIPLKPKKVKNASYNDKVLKVRLACIIFLGMLY